MQRWDSVANYFKELSPYCIFAFSSSEEQSGKMLPGRRREIDELSFEDGLHHLQPELSVTTELLLRNFYHAPPESGTSFASCRINLGSFLISV